MVACDKASIPGARDVFFLRRQGTSIEAEYARARLVELKKQQVAAL